MLIQNAMLADAIAIDSVTALGIAAGGISAIVSLFWLLQSAKDKENARLLSELDGVKKSYQEMAAEAIKSATETTNFYRQREGKPPIIAVAPVIPESRSPATAAQRETAMIATMRAQMALIKLETGQEPRGSSDKSGESAVPAFAPTTPTVAPGQISQRLDGLDDVGKKQTEHLESIDGHLESIDKKTIAKK